MKFWTIVGLGPNDVKIPCLIFGTKEAAVSYMRPILGDVRGDKRLYWNAECLEKDHGVNMHQSNKFFTGYYGGCGGCYVFELVEVEEGKPFVRWDLD